MNPRNYKSFPISIEVKSQDIKPNLFQAALMMNETSRFEFSDCTEISGGLNCKISGKDLAILNIPAQENSKVSLSNPQLYLNFTCLP